jgi:acyl phosphate:glycerol-3-phosphate acyltransferase
VLDAPLTWLLAGAIGYLAGSVSFARIIGRLVAPGVDLTRTTIDSPRTGEAWGIHGAQASSLTGRAPWPWRLLVVLLDMAKAGVPTLAFRMAFPGDPAYAVAFAAAVIGHNWPVYHRFLGGFGISSIIGGTLAINPLALLVTIPVGVGIGRLFLDNMSMVNGFAFLLPVWYLVVDRNIEATLASVAVVVAYTLAKRGRLTYARVATGPVAAEEPAPGTAEGAG